MHIYNEVISSRLQVTHRTHICVNEKCIKAKLKKHLTSRLSCSVRPSSTVKSNAFQIAFIADNAVFCAMTSSVCIQMDPATE